MRFSDYLAALPPAAQTTLTNNLTVGCGRVMLAARLLESGSSTRGVLGSLTAAYYDLHAGYTTLGMAAPRQEGPARWEVTRSHLPSDWGGHLTVQTPAVLTACLAPTAARVHDLGAAVQVDAELGVIQAVLGDLLRSLAILPDSARAPRLNGQSPLHDEPRM